MVLLPLKKYMMTKQKEIINSVIKGYNATLLAYGKSPSGKTHTMIRDMRDKDSEYRGIIPRMIDDLYLDIRE